MTLRGLGRGMYYICRGGKTFFFCSSEFLAETSVIKDRLTREKQIIYH